jgi:acyl dehydratase
MPIDVDKVLAADLPAATSSWTPDDVILYHLGVGAGAQPTDPGELEYAYEGKLKVLPSYGVIPVSNAVLALFGTPGLDVNWATVLHGEQELELLQPLPTSAEIVTTPRVSGIYDKGKAALVVLETTSSNSDGTPLFINRFSLFFRGEGGWGGDAGAPPASAAPDRAPDIEVERTTLPQQALLYRLNGDKNPLHADPEFSKLGGFDQPILHGLCSYGIVCKAVVDEALGGDVAQVANYRARFAGVLFPGETLVVQMWREAGKVLVQARCKERDTPVITNAAITLR